VRLGEQAGGIKRALAPLGDNERLMKEAGLTVLAVEDTTEQLAEIARRRHDARACGGREAG
jgi:hypothetical protein